ncbi:MAG TPA: transaminase [Gaiellaceae bacterium]|nr:transaminase [Gaiellaceae bacterium]
MAVAAEIDPRRLAALRQREDERFVAARPRSLELREQGRTLMPYGVPMSWMASLWDHPPLFVAEGHGATFTDVDGHSYLDFHIADTSAFCGHAPEPVTRAVAEQAARGAQFQLPTEDSLWVAAELASRWSLPQWQFTLSATTANVEAIRLARHATGRETVLMFDGKYHGHGDDTLVILDDDGESAPEYFGVPREASARARIVQFNDPDGLARALASGDVACVLAEPAMTNLTIVQPDPGFHEELRRLTREAGTLLVLDETHTLVCGPGGLVARWRLDPDLVTIGKSIGGGITVGAYGMTAELAERFETHEGQYPASGDFAGEVATGGTLFANALSMAACRAALGEVLTPEAYERTAALGGRLADGIESAAVAAGLDWTAHRLYAKSGYWFGPELPRNALEARGGDDLELRAYLRVALANRGIWEGGFWLGPAVSVAMEEAGVDRYAEALGEVLFELTS